ncbi:MAG TPA: HD domain-containing protein [Candidatus Atribacteria bacterium]|nr:HD domain-containing protein [Candidatus Atribacteria bacterium]HPT79204.1 HD domain-containing protein [Candidatus Atribacteria bacterium]
MMKQNWLELLKKQLEDITFEAAKEYWPSPNEGNKPFFNYRLEHVRQVERDALKILEHVCADRDVVLASVWLHDMFQPQFKGEDHGRLAAVWAEHNLAKTGFPQEKVAEVCYAVSVHSGRSAGIPDDKPEAQVLWDADKVSHIGPVELISYLLNQTAKDVLSGRHGAGKFSDHTITLKELAPILAERWPDKIDPDMFYFPVTRQIARERIAAQIAFLDVLTSQV